MGGYLQTVSAVAGEFCDGIQIGIDVLHPSSYPSGQASLISMVFSCLGGCHSLQKSLLLFVPTK